MATPTDPSRADLDHLPRATTSGDAPQEPGLPAAPLTSAEETVGVGLGMVAGAAAGAIAGPAGMVVGAALGAMIGDAAGSAMHDREDELSARDHALDDSIGVTSGPVGVGKGFAGPRVRPPGGATSLPADHQMLDFLAEDLLARITAGDRADVTGAAAELRTRVLAHLDGEERLLIPQYALRAPDDAALLLAEHTELRAALARLDVASDLRETGAVALAAFITNLRAHTAREEAGLYRAGAAVVAS